MKGLLSHFAVYGYSSMDCGCELPLVFLLDVCFRVSDDNVIEAIFWRVCKGVCVSGGEGGGLYCGIGLLMPNLASWLKITIRWLHISWPLKIYLYRLYLYQHIHNKLVL